MKRILEPEVMDTREEAEAYDAMDHGEVSDLFVGRIIELGACEGKILDLGTGTADIPILLAQRLPKIQIVGIDLSLNMLKLGEAHVADAGLADRIVLECVDAKSLPYPDQSFDGIISNSIIHHIPDPMPALREISRTVRSGGLIMIRDLIRPETPEAAQTLVNQYAADDTAYQKNLLYNSFRAAFTIAEVEAMHAQVDLPDATVVQSSDRHWSIERPFDRS
ncbi:MAG: methyltransferase domain-containing protein [Candidatus Poribacteria bacterium]|nr:methyltransferase domain-containing protein [Candidatus Poribacteria bacterium]